MHQRVTLRACFLKTNLNEKIRLLILSNLSPDKVSLEGLADVYLSHWPNLEETFQDFSRKIELFTYMASSQRFFSMENLNLNKAASPDINTLFNQYLKVLDLYVRWHFLPSDYEDRDFSTMKEQFYGLKAIFNRQKNYLQVTFQPPLGFPLLKDLEYICRRLSEKEIVSPDGKRLWFLT